MKISKIVAILPIILVAGCASYPTYSGGTLEKPLVDAGRVTSGSTTSTIYRPESPFWTAAPIAVDPAVDPDFY
jgi:hypothetical protein